MERMALLGGGSLSSKGKGRAIPDIENSQSDNVPLMTPGGARSDQQNYSRQGYSNAPGVGLNPGEQGRAAPKLHPGLGALGQNYS